MLSTQFMVLLLTVSMGVGRKYMTIFLAILYIPGVRSNIEHHGLEVVYDYIVPTTLQMYYE